MNEYFEKITSAGSDAPWITMVHAMTQDRRVFSAQVEAFQKDYQILLIDLPGHGRATSAPGPYGHLEMMQHVSRVLHQAQIGPTHFWATHTGTAIGLLLAVREPDRIKTLILEGAVISGYAMPYVSDTLAKAGAKARNEGIEAAIRDVFYQADWYDVMRTHPDECRADAHWNILKDFAGAPWTDGGVPEQVTLTDADLSAITVPTLLYNGEHDLKDFFDVARHLEASLPNIEHAIIPKAGGFPAWEFPSPVNEVVRDFIQRQT